MTSELIGVLTIGAVVVIATFGGMWSVVRELQRDLTNLREKVAGMCIAPGSLDTSLSHAAGLSDIAVCHA